jgi:PAS domain S-box
MKELISGDIKEFSMAKRYYHKSGEIIWVKLYVSPMWKTETQPDYHIAVVEDITNLKIAESELNHQKELLQTIIDNIPVLITLYFFNEEFQLIKRMDSEKGYYENEKWTFDSPVYQILESTGETKKVTYPEKLTLNPKTWKKIKKWPARDGILRKLLWRQIIISWLF